MRSSSADHERLERAAEGLGDIEQGAQRPRREEGLAGPAQDPRLRSTVLAELAHECRLADPCLAGDE